MEIGDAWHIGLFRLLADERAHIIGSFWKGITSQVGYLEFVIKELYQNERDYS